MLQVKYCLSRQIVEENTQNEDKTFTIGYNFLLK